MLPRPVGAVLREVVRVRHAGNDVSHVTDRRPVLAVGRHVIAARLAEDIRADIDAVFMQDVRRVHQKALDGLRLGLVIFVVEVDIAFLFIVTRAVRETDIVELDLVEAHGLDRVDGKRDLILPHVPAERARPVARRDIQGIARAVRDGVFRMILAEEGVVERGQTADHIEARVLDFLDDRLIFLDRIVGVLVRRRRIFLVHGRVIADGRAVHDVDDKGVDLRGLCVFDVLVDIAQHSRVAGQIDRIAGIRHRVIRKIGFGTRIIVQTFRVAAAPLVAAAGMDGVDTEAVIDLVCCFRRGSDVLAADVAGLALIGDLIQVDNAVRRPLIVQHLQLRPLLDQRSQHIRILLRPQILRRADIHSLFRDHLMNVLRQILLRDVAVAQRGEIRHVIGHAVLPDGLVGRVGDLHAACDSAALAEVFIVIGNFRCNGADIARFIARRVRLRGLRLVRRLRRRAGDHEDEQHDRDEDQPRDHHAPRMLAEELLQKRQSLRALLLLRRAGNPLSFA